MTSHIRPGPLGSTEHDVGGGLSRQRPMRQGHGAHPVQPKMVQIPSAIGSACTPDESASETQRQLRRLPTNVRVIHLEASQEKTAAEGDRSEPQGLPNRTSPDVAHLISIFKDTVARMDAAGERKHPCAKQAAEIMAALTGRAQTRAPWAYTYEQRIPGPVPLHIWVKAQSDNPSDPVLHLDAWRNEVRVEPAAAPALQAALQILHP